MIRREVSILNVALVTGFLLIALAQPALAVDDEVRSDCEYQVQAYGLTDDAEYEAAIHDCIAQAQGSDIYGSMDDIAEQQAVSQE